MAATKRTKKQPTSKGRKGATANARGAKVQQPASRSAKSAAPSKKSPAKGKPKTSASPAKSKAKPKPPAKPATKVKAKPKAAAPKKPAPKKPAASKAPPSSKKVSTTVKTNTKSKKQSAAKSPASTESRPVERAANGPAAGGASSGRGKSISRQFMVDLADHIRQAVLPSVKAAKGREIVGTAASGDPTFKIDSIAEKALLNYLRDTKEPVAYYSEDQGYTTFSSGQPQVLLVIDPIDGTRAAKCGFESCVVSVASTRVIERPRLSDVDSGCVMEILGDRTFYAERGKGVKVYQEGQPKKARLSSNANLELMSWAMTVTARPAELIFPTAAKLIDLTSLKGGFFACNSTSFSLTRLLTDQLDACVDFANRYYRDIPEAVNDHFINAGRGTVLGIAPYDIAASLLVAQEGGCIVTDAYGKSFDDVLLLDTSTSNLRSMIAASNKELHGLLMTFFDTRIKQYEQLLKRRTQAAERA